MTTGAIIGGTVAATTQIGHNVKNSIDVKAIRADQGLPKQPAPGQAPSKTAADMANAQLNELYGEKVVSATPIERPLDATGGKAVSPLVNHKGVLIKTESGKQYVIESGQNYGKYSDCILKDANNLGSKMGWKFGETLSVSPDTNVQKLLAAGQQVRRYNLIDNNCGHA